MARKKLFLKEPFYIYLLYKVLMPFLLLEENAERTVMSDICAHTEVKVRPRSRYSEVQDL